MLAALLLALLLLAPPDTTDGLGPVAADSTERAPVEIKPRIFPSAFFSVTKGFGVGGGVVVKNLAWPGTRLTLSAQPMQRFGRYRASFFTGDPFAVPLFAGVGGEYVDNQVRGFYGIGPRSSRDNSIFVDLQEVEAEVRLGWYPFGTARVLVQPVVRLLHAEVRSFRNRDQDAFLRLDPASQRGLFASVDRPSTGVTYGLEAAWDRRDKLFYSSDGTLTIVTARRYDGLGENAFRYWSGTASHYAFFPLPPRRHILYTRAVVALTRQIGDAPLPFYALPLLDDQLLGAYTRYRFNGNDLLALTLGYRLPVYTYLDWFALDANAQFSVANAYDDLFAQFEPGISFSNNLDGDGRRTPLRPALSIGLRLVDLGRDRIIIGGQLGVDPEGYKFGTLRLVFSIRDLRPLVR